VNLQEKAEALTAGAKCDMSVLCQGLDADKPLISINADAVFSSASVIKVPILLTLFEQARLGALSLEQTVNVKSITQDTAVFDSGPRRASLRELAVWMTVLSDNTSTNALIDVLGFDAVNLYIKNSGLKNTALRRKMLDFASREAGVDNVTTAEDMFTLFKRVFSGSGEGDAEVIAILRGQRSKQNLMRYIWEDAVIAHKTGGLDYLSHDAGVFTFGDKHVFVGVFLWNTERIEGDPRLIGSVGRLVFEYFSRGGV
jgi:beta-lactamase class A